MLYTEAKQYLLEKIKAAGVRTNPYTTWKKLRECRDSHIGAVLFEREAYTRNGSKKQFRDEAGAKHKRRKVFDRDLTFTVIIGDYTDDAVEAIFDAFISALDSGIYAAGNYIPITLDGAEWVDEDDSILKAKVAVQAAVTFHGGVYRDTDFAPLSRVELVEIEKENGKEPEYGK